MASSKFRQFIVTGSSQVVLAQAMALEIQQAPVAKEASAFDELPQSHPDWRVNEAALYSAGIVQNSPLETRQQRRSAAKALSRGLATAGKLQEREARVKAKKAARAMAAHRRFKRIEAHVPTPPAD